MYVGIYHYRGLRLRLFLFFLIILSIALISSDYLGYAVGPVNGIEALAWLTDPGTSFLSALVIFSGTTLIIGDYFKQIQLSGTSNLLIIRSQTRRCATLKAYVTIFLTTFILMLSTFVLVGLAIHLLRFPMVFNNKQLVEELQFGYSWASLVWIIFSRAWGISVFTMFAFAVGLWIPRLGLYRLSGLIISLTMYLGVATMGDVSWLRMVGAALFLPNLIAPTTVADFGPYLLHISPILLQGLSIIIYLGLTCLLTMSWQHHEAEK